MASKTSGNGLPNPYLLMSRYGPVALCAFGLAMVLYAMIVQRPSPITITWIVMGVGAFIAGVVLPRVKGAVEVGTQGVKAELDDVRAIEDRVVQVVETVVTATAEKVAEATIPEQPDKDSQVAEQVKVVRDAVTAAEHNLSRELKSWLLIPQPKEATEVLRPLRKQPILSNVDPELEQRYRDGLLTLMWAQNVVRHQPKLFPDETADQPKLFRDETGGEEPREKGDDD